MYGPHNGLELCVPEIDRSAYPCGRNPYSSYLGLCVDFPGSSIDE
jgi:hypothetical protein